MRRLIRTFMVVMAFATLVSSLRGPRRKRGFPPPSPEETARWEDEGGAPVPPRGARELRDGAFGEGGRLRARL